MLNAIEDKFMVNQVNDAANLKPVDADNRLKAKQADIKNSASEHSFFLDNVSLSNTSKQLEALKSSLSDSPEINAARVLYFQTEIKLGNYQINSEHIAKSLLNNVEMA